MSLVNGIDHIGNFNKTKGILEARLEQLGKKIEELSPEQIEQLEIEGVLRMDEIPPYALKQRAINPKV